MNRAHDENSNNNGDNHGGCSDSDGWNAIIIKWNQMNCSWTIWPNYVVKLHKLRYIWPPRFYSISFSLHNPSIHRPLASLFLLARSLSLATHRINVLLTHRNISVNWFYIVTLCVHTPHIHGHKWSSTQRLLFIGEFWAMELFVALFLWSKWHSWQYTHEAFDDKAWKGKEDGKKGVHCAKLYTLTANLDHKTRKYSHDWYKNALKYRTMERKCSIVSIKMIVSNR